MATPTAIVAYLALFAGVAAVFLLVNLLVGRLVRPKNPNQEKLEVYECGEPVIGSSFVQFDLRFYVVALLFIIFDVEIAFFFPWATVFGKTVQLTSPNMPVASASLDEGDNSIQYSHQATVRLKELGIVDPQPQAFSPEELKQLDVTDGGAAVVQNELRDTAQKIALTSFADIGVFFAVLLVGFAYVWRRGDLDWVRAVSSNQGEVVERSPPKITVKQPRPAGSILSK